MKGIIRPGRGRASKVTKSIAPRRPGRPPVGHDAESGTAGNDNGQQHNDQEHLDQQLLEHKGEPAFDENGDIEVGDGDAEAEAEMEDDDPATTAAHSASHTQNVDLSTAANILANGSAAPSSAGLMHEEESRMNHGMQAAAQAAEEVAIQMSGHGMDPGVATTTQQLAQDSGYDNFVVESALAKRLARDPGLRLAHQRRPEQTLNLTRRSNVEALFAHIAGELAPIPCKNCHKGHGPWNCCVVVDGQMCGSCANCWFNASGARCSFHETRNPPNQLHQHHPALISSTSTASIPHDATGSFNLPQAIAMAPQHQVSSALHNLDAAGSFTNDPVARYAIDRAVAEVRAADKKTRQLIAIEVKAKLLALQIVEYEDAVRDDPHSQHQSQQQHLHQPGSHSGVVMGDGEHQEPA